MLINTSRVRAADAVAMVAAIVALRRVYYDVMIGRVVYSVVNGGLRRRRRWALDIFVHSGPL